MILYIINGIVCYNKILKQADKITYVSNCNYYNGCMAKRNKYMIDSVDGIKFVFLKASIIMEIVNNVLKI